MKYFSTIILFAIFSFCLNFQLFSQPYAKYYFVNMPDSVLPLLTAVNRADCIDFLESNMRARVDNRFGKSSEMKVLAKDYIEVEMSSQSSWQMKLLPVNDSTMIIATVSTVCAPVCDSDVKFYNTNWEPLIVDSIIPQKPLLSNFLQDTDTLSVVDIKNRLLALDALFVSASFAPDTNALIYSFNTPDYIEKETAEKLAPYLRRQLKYVWTDGRFLLSQVGFDK